MHRLIRRPRPEPPAVAALGGRKRKQLIRRTDTRTVAAAEGMFTPGRVMGRKQLRRRTSGSN
jgi:hypothetical protein